MNIHRTRTKILVASVVAAVTFAVFLPALRNGFINFDDTEYVYENPFIRSLDLQFFKSACGFYFANWHPLTWLSHALDYALWGLNPMGHHLTNNILHALNTLIVVLLVIRLMEVYKKTEEDNGVSLSFLNSRTIGITGAITGLLFGLHPLHVESVAWVAERKDLLCAFFFLLAVITYTHYVSDINASSSRNYSSFFFNKKYLFALGFFILSLLSKPMAITLPFVLLILDWYLFERMQSRSAARLAFIEKIPFFALTLMSAIVTLLAQKAGGAIRSLEVLPLAPRVIIAAKSLITYLMKMIVPLNLVPFYPYPNPRDISLFSAQYITAIIIVIAITAACVAGMKKHGLWMSVWAYYVITLMPVSGIIQVGSQSMADRYTYLPSLGVFLLIGLTAARVYEKAEASPQWGMTIKKAGFLIAVTLLVSMSYATVRQVGIWKNSIVFWNYIIKEEPGKVPFAYNNLGGAYSAKGLLDLAIEQYRTALRLKPGYAAAHNNLGGAYSAKGLLDLAIEQYRTALRLKPGYAEAHNNLGQAYSSKGLLDMAIEQYRIALRLKPGFAEAHNNLGEAYSSKGWLDMAMEQCRIALRLKPDLAAAHYNLGLIYQAKGFTNMARTEFESVLRISPRDYWAGVMLNSLSQSKH